MNKSRQIFCLFVISLVLISCILPAGADTSPGNHRTSADEKNISIAIYYPEENGVSYQDVVGLPIVVQGEVDAVNGIQNVTISDGMFNSICKDKNQKKTSHFNINCEVPRNYNVSEGKNQYIISVFDTQNHMMTITRHFTIIGSIPPPEFFKNECSAHGKVTNTMGNPVPNATLLFEIPDVIVWGPEINDFRSYLRITKTDSRGAYDTSLIGDCRDHNHQNVTITKQGYQKYFQQLEMKEISNEVNFVITPVNVPSGQKTPGFDLPVGLYSLIIGLMLVQLKKRG